MPKSREFTLKELYSMLEQYQNFVCNGVVITSPIHVNGPDMCRQLIKILEDRQSKSKKESGHAD